MNNRPETDDRDTFEDFHHEEVFALEMEIRHVLDCAGPEALAAMQGVEKVRQVWRRRSDGGDAKTEIDVWFKKKDGNTGYMSFPGGKWCSGRIGMERSQISPELFGDDTYFDEKGQCWGKIEQNVSPDPVKLAAFKAGLLPHTSPDQGDEDKAAARDAMAARIAGIVMAVFVGIMVVSSVGAESILGKAFMLAVVIGIVVIIVGRRKR